MNLLITTLGTSWQIIPELVSITNPQKYDFFCGSKISCEFRKNNNIKPVDEVWVITTEGQFDLEKLKAWAENWKVKLNIFVCDGVNTFKSEEEILKMRSFIYRIVLNGTQHSEVTYLSLSGGRKTMSADMQEAGNLFGCDAMLHVVDVAPIPAELRSDTLLGPAKKEYSTVYMPLLVNSKIRTNLLVCADNEPINSLDFLLEFTVCQYTENCCSIFYLNEDGSLEKEIQNRKNRSSQVYANFYNRINSVNHNKRDLFRKLYFLHPETLQNLQKYEIGKNPQKDYEILKSLPKAELHTHLGGVLSPKEIIQVALTEKDYVIEGNNQNSINFYNHIQKILQYENDTDAFSKLIYKDYSDEKNFYKIGIEKYQTLGDFQGSSLLQTKNTITKTLELYAKNLIEHNVKYVEIRCSPYKYTKLGLTTKQVIEYILGELDKYKEHFEYRLIYIIGRQAEKSQIEKTIKEIVELLDTNKNFSQKLVGIDLAGNEGITKPSELRNEFMPLLERCIKITIHAGETESVESIWEAVYHLSADRIGHGLNLLEKPELLKRFIDKNIGVELCPSSNDQIVGFNSSLHNSKRGVEKREYPLKKYMEEGLKVCINTDDQGISKTNITNEYIKAAALCKRLTLWDVIVLIRNSLSIAFCDAKTKNELMHKIEDELLEIVSGL